MTSNDNKQHVRINKLQHGGQPECLQFLRFINASTRLWRDQIVAWRSSLEAPFGTGRLTLNYRIPNSAESPPADDYDRDGYVHHPSNWQQLGTRVVTPLALQPQWWLLPINLAVIPFPQPWKAVE